MLHAAITVPQGRHFINRGFQPPDATPIHVKSRRDGTLKRTGKKCRPCGTCPGWGRFRGLKPPVNKMPSLRDCENPNGVQHQSPGLRVSALPWVGMFDGHQPQRGCTSSNCKHRAMMCNPVGVVQSLLRKPRVARIRATLGFDLQPPWGCGRHP